MATECVPAEDSKVEWLGRMLIALLIGLLPALANVVPLCISMHVLTTAPRLPTGGATGGVTPGRVGRAADQTAAPVLPRDCRLPVPSPQPAESPDAHCPPNRLREDRDHDPDCG